MIVIDASLTVWTLLPELSPLDTVRYFTRWRKDEIELYVPSLWLAECTSAIRRYVHAGMITSEEGFTAIEDLISLDVIIVPMTHAHCTSAYKWAEQLGQSRAYDSFYLALAEDLGATLFTTDKRLGNGAKQLGLSWVQWIGIK